MSNVTSQQFALSVGGRVRAAVICVLGVTAVLVSTVGPASAIPVFPQCFVTGGGSVDGDTFGGHAASYRNEDQVDGNWTHTTQDGRTLQGDVDHLICRRNGGQPGHLFDDFSIADFAGSGTFDGQDLRFTGRANDHGEPPGDDSYGIAIADADANIIYQISGTLDSGNVQIHGTNLGHP